MLAQVTQGASNAQYTSKCGAVMSTPILADECQDISPQEELSICCRWIVDGYPEEHFLDILYVKDVDAASITQSLTSIDEKHLDCKRLVGQGYDGAATSLVV